MGIRFRCPACTKKIHVKDFLAGKRGICPKCGAGVDIPLESEWRGKTDRRAPEGSPIDADGNHDKRRPAKLQVGRLIGTSPYPTTDPLDEAPEATWFVGPSSTTADVGPFDGDGVRTLLERGEVSAATPVRRNDWNDAPAAGTVWPSRFGAGNLAAAAAKDSPAGDGPRLVAQIEPSLPPVAVASQTDQAALAEAGSAPQSAEIYYRGTPNRRYVVAVVVLSTLLVLLAGLGYWVLVLRRTA